MKDLVDLPLGAPSLRALQARTQARHRSAYRFALLLMLFAAVSSSLLSQQFATLNLTVGDPAGSVIAQATCPSATWIRELSEAEFQTSLD
jgi:hypothetical protein